IPACGYKVFYVVPNETTTEPPISTDTFNMKFRGLENQFYLIKVSLQGIISIYDKKGGNWYENVCYFEDVGDWGDEYDFSGPNENQTDLKFTTEDLNILEILPYIDGPTQKTLVIRGNLNLPASLTEDRYSRENYLLSNPINIYISLYNNIKRIDFRIELGNNSKDHRIRVLFPSKLITNTVKCDGHFYVISRDIDLPAAVNWAQKPLPTNHQKDFISVTDEKTTYAVLNKGLPEYEAIKNNDNTLTLAITLLRSVEWLSRHDFATRKSNAGPDLNTPEAQCLGKHTFNLSVVIEDKSNWIEAGIHKRGKEFNNPLKLIFPSMARSSLRVSDKVILIPFGLISYETVFVSGTRKVELEAFLPTELSFLEIDNAKVILSALKKSEEEDFVIIRVYNISPESQTTEFKFYEKLHIFEAKIVNLLEEAPINPIKASINFFQDNIINITINPHVIATLKLKFKKKI
ncbi:MAG: glycoside hydrolase family 38 C-terminal domain-containing protein, partial [Candidatus Hermodarchaeota archaeon]